MLLPFVTAQLGPHTKPERLHTMLEMMLKSIGGYEGLIKLIISQSGISQEDMQRAIANISSLTHNLNTRLENIERDISDIKRATCPVEIGVSENG